MPSRDRVGPFVAATEGEVMFDVYESRRLPRYRLVVPRRTDIAAYDRWDGDWRFVKSTADRGKERKERIAEMGHYLYRLEGFFPLEVSSLND